MNKTFIAIALMLLASPILLATDRSIDTARSKITIHVGKTGLFSAAGHEHEVSAPIAEGAIDDSGAGRIWFRVEAAKLQVLPEKDQAAVQKDMQDKVLESATFPQIRFESTAIRKVAEGKWAVTGNLTLHGKTNPVTVDVGLQGNAYAGQATIKQSQFGIKSVSAAGGAVKVKDELRIEFVIVAAN